MGKNFDWKVYAPYFLGVSFAFLLLFVWYLSALTVEKSIVPESVRLLLTGLFGLFTALVAAALGYLFNSRLNEKKAEYDRKLDTEKKEKEIIAALQSTLFLLSAKLHQLRCFYDGNMKTLNDLSETERAHQFPAFLPNFEIDQFDLINLIPLQKKLEGDLLNLSILDQRYLQSFQTLNSRSELHHKQIQPIYEKWLTKNKQQPSEVSYMDYFCSNYEKLNKELILSTNNCYELINTTIHGFEDMQIKLLSLAQETYPKEDFFDLETILKKNIKQ